MRLIHLSRIQCLWRVWRIWWWNSCLSPSIGRILGIGTRCSNSSSDAGILSLANFIRGWSHLLVVWHIWISFDWRLIVSFLGWWRNCNTLPVISLDLSLLLYFECPQSLSRMRLLRCWIIVLTEHSPRGLGWKGICVSLFCCIGFSILLIFHLMMLSLLWRLLLLLVISARLLAIVTSFTSLYLTWCCVLRNLIWALMSMHELHFLRGLCSKVQFTAVILLWLVLNLWKQVIFNNICPIYPLSSVLSVLLSRKHSIRVPIHPILSMVLRR